MNERLLTIDETADLLNLHPETVRDWARAGRLPGAFKVGRVWRFRLSSLTAWMDEKTGQAEAQPVLPQM